MNTNNTSSSLYGLDIYNGSSHILYARNDGFIGIGTFAPGFKLDVIGRSRFQSGGGSAGFWLTNAANSTDRAFIGMLDDNTFGFYGGGSVSWPLTMNVNTGNIVISPKSGSAAGLTINSGATNSLNVIGNSYLFGNMGINSNPNSAYGLIVSGGTSFALYSNGKVYSTGNVGIGTYPNDSYGLQVNGGTVASIMASSNIEVGNNAIVYGRLGVGTGSPNIKLDVSGMIRAMGAEAPTSGAGLELSYSSGVGYVEAYDRTSNLQKPLCLAATNVYPWQQVSLGNPTNRWYAVYAAIGTIQTSDIRLKKDILPLQYGIEEVMQLKPVSFKWKKSNDEQRRLGLIAQDVLPVISEIVDVGTDTEATLGLNYSELTPVLIRAIQDQQQQIESTKQENQQLKSELQSLKEEMDQIKALLLKGGTN